MFDYQTSKHAHFDAASGLPNVMMLIFLDLSPRGLRLTKRFFLLMQPLSLHPSGISVCFRS